MRELDPEVACLGLQLSALSPQRLVEIAQRSALGCLKATHAADPAPPAPPPAPPPTHSENPSVFMEAPWSGTREGLKHSGRKGRTSQVQSQWCHCPAGPHCPEPPFPHLAQRVAVRPQTCLSAPVFLPLARKPRGAERAGLRAPPTWPPGSACPLSFESLVRVPAVSNAQRAPLLSCG